MTSSSSLYGSVTTQNSSSSNSTSLYGEAGTPIPDSSGNVIVRGDLYVLSGNILTTATTGNIFPANATTINLGNAATTVNIGAGTGTTTINNNLVVDGTGTFAGDITATGGDFGNITIGVTDNNTINNTANDLILTAVTNEIGLGTTNTLYTTSSTFNLLNAPTSVFAFRNATTLELGEDTGTTGINNNLRVDGTDINLAQNTGLLYSEANNRLNRLYVQSTTGNSSGLRIRAPNATTSASSSLSVSNSDDPSSSKFMSVQATGSTTEPFRIVTGEYIANVLNPSGDSISIRDGVTQYATINPAGPTVSTDLTTKAYVDAQISTGAVTSITGTADQVIASSPTGAVTLSLPQSIGTTNSPTFAGATLGAITVGVATDNTITTTSGDLAITATGSNGVEITSGTTEPTRITRNSGSTTGGVRSLALNVQSSGTPTVGFGNSLEWEVEAQPGNTERAGYVSVYSTDLTAGSEDFAMSFGLMTNGAVADTKMTLDNTGALDLDGDLTVGGTTVNLAQDTTFAYSENNARANRLQVQSTTGNSSGFRVLAPNATTSAVSNLTVFATDDIDNGEFLSLQSTGSTTAPFSIRTGKYTAGVLGASSEEINITDGGTTYASINPAGPTNSTDLTTKSYVDGLIPNVPTYDTTVVPATGGVDLQLREIDVPSITIVGTTTFLGGTNVTVSETSPNVITISAPDTNTTYDFNASSTTGGANLNLVGSDSTTDTVKLTNGGHITATYTSATEVTLGSDATDANTANAIVSRDASGNFAASGATLGNITIGVADDQTITTTSGNLILDSVGGTLQLNDAAISSPVAQTWTVVDNTASALSIGATGKADILKIVTTDGSEQLTTSAQFTADSASLDRFIRTVNSGVSNVVVELSRNRSDSVRVADQGAWLGLGYVGTDNTQATAGQNAIRSMYDATGNHKLQFLQIPGNYSTPTAIGQMQRGNTFFNNTTGTAALFLGDTSARIGGNTTTITNSANTATYATFISTAATLNGDTVNLRNSAGTTTYGNFTSTGTTITGAGLSQITRTTVGTPGSSESRPSFNIQLSRSDQAAPNDFDGTGFRYRVNGSNATNYTIADMSANYRTGGDNTWQLQLANGDQTGATFSGLTTLQSKITGTTIAAGTASGTPGGSSVSTVATFQPTQTFLQAGGTTYASLSSTGQTFTSSGRMNIIRNTPGTGVLLRQQTANTDPVNGDEMDFRLGIAGTVTSSDFARFDGTYRSSGDNEIGMSVSTDSFSTDTDRIYVGSRATTKIRATPSGGGTASDILTVTDTNVTSARPFVFPSYTAAAANAITGAVGWQIAITDSGGGGNPNGMMAFWDTTNARWSYIHDNSAV